MGRAIYRQNIKDFKITAKAINSCVRRNVDTIVQFVQEHTSQSDIVLYMISDDMSEYKDKLFKALVVYISSVYESNDTYRSVRLTSDLEIEDETFTVVNIINAAKSSHDIFNTLQGIYNSKVANSLLESDVSDETKRRVQSIQKSMLENCLTIAYLDILPLTQFNKEDLLQYSQDANFIILIIRAWLLIKPVNFSVLRTKGWVNDCESIEDVCNLLELDETLTTSILELFEVKDDSFRFKETESSKAELLKSYLPIYRLAKEQVLGDDAVDMLFNNDEPDISDFIKSMLKLVDIKSIVKLEDDELCIDMLSRNALLDKKSTECLLTLSSTILSAKQQADWLDINELNEKLTSKITRLESNIAKYKETNAKLQSKINSLEKELKPFRQQKQLTDEMDALKEENVSLKNQIEKLKSHINSLKSANTTDTQTDVAVDTLLSVAQPVEETPKVSLEEMLDTINKYRLTILGGPTNFSARVKEYIPNATVIDRDSKFGQIRIGDSDYLIIYWKILGHARVMQAEAQAKRVGAKIILVDSTNRNLFCKQVFDQL